jgi:dienelactone hydrolase
MRQLILPLLLPTLATAEPMPQSITELWADFDPSKDALETEVIREWKEDGGVFRHVRYLIGHFKGKPARMAAIYGFPEGMKEKLPAVMHIHGGGQRASLDEVRTLVGRGYAALSVNWGGDGDGKPPFNTMDAAKPGDPNTDWGAVDPSQLNVQGYSTMLPGPKQFFEDREHPKNNNWYLLTLGCRRGLTFLEQQPEVDAQRLGVHGYSMGGNLTMYVAGTDNRVKAAVPAVGGQGWRWQAQEFIGGTAQQEQIKGDVEVFRRTLSFESYAPLIRCPVLHRSATNDFHGWMDGVHRTNALIPNQPLRYAWTPHMNHRLSPEVAVTMPLWFDQHLKGGPALPETPSSELQITTTDGVPVMRVVPDKSSLLVTRVDIYYSVDPDPRARFWRDAVAVRKGDTWEAKLPILSTGQALYAFANAYHKLPRTESLPHMAKIDEVCLSTQLHIASSAELLGAKVKATDQPTRLIDDFTRGWHDWYRLGTEHKPFWQNWTRKITDPKWRGPDGASLAITLKLSHTNRISFVLMQNEWRGYRGPRQVFTCHRKIQGLPQSQTVAFSLADFKNADGQSPANWQQIDQLGLCARYEERVRGQSAQPATWNGEMPVFERVEWRMPVRQ